MSRFQIPIVLVMFKRTEKTLKIIDRLSIVKPTKIYLLSDEGRTDEEKRLVQECRTAVEKRIDWDCEVVKNYAKKNRGVYANIGLGAKWVFEREETAIFLEDDNLPELTFFDYCKEMLEMYRDDERILWVCGTNYLGNYESETNESYMFTQHLLPCGWASWSGKFQKYYDGELLNAEESNNIEKIKKRYKSKVLYKQQMEKTLDELQRKKNGQRFSSWDYQMAFSLKHYNLFGISPKDNQIKNIGVDEYSEHGGNSFDLVMTKRLCGMDSHPLEFPLKHPPTFYVDPEYDKSISKIIEYPLSMRVKRNISKVIKKIMRIEKNESLKRSIKKFGAK